MANKFNLKDLYGMQIGGTIDTLALTALGLSGVLTSPIGGSIPLLPLQLSLAAIGSGWLGFRTLEGWSKLHLLKTPLHIRSSKSPVSRKLRKSGLLLGYATDTGEEIFIEDEDLTRHLFVLGQSGVGKTVFGSLFLFQQIQRGGGLLFLDGKCNVEDLHTMYQLCVWCGRERDLLVINPGDPDMTNTYNPILYGDPSEVASRILSLIPSSEGNAGTDYYRQAANQGIKTLVSALQRAGLAYNFIDLAVLLQNHRALEELEAKLNAIAPGSDEAKGFSLFVDQFRVTNTNRGGQQQEAQIDMKRLKEVFGGVGGRMHTFGTGDFGKILNSYAPDVNLYDAIRQNKILYVMLPTLGKSEDAQNFAKMMLGDFRTAVSWLYKIPENERPNPPYLAFLDEANSYANTSWAPVFEQGRGARIILMPAAQTIAGYREISKSLAERIIGNTWTKLFFKIGTQESAVEAADLIGMEMKTKRSISTSTSKSTMADSLRTEPESKASQSEVTSESVQESEDYKVSPDDLKGLMKGECVVTYGGDSLYDINIPMIKFTKQFKKEVGPARINRFRKKHVTGADFFKNSEKYLSKAH